jgi:tetratricopeptide (TPR) repeat protein
LLTLLGYANLTLGRFEIGNALMERGANLAAIHNVSTISAFALCTLAEGHMLHGNLYLAEKLAGEAFQLADSQNDNDGMRRSLVYQAWVRYMRGDRDGMGGVLQDGQRRFSDFPSVDDVHGVGRWLRGLYLFWMENAAEARELLGATAEACERRQYWNQASRCRRILGEKAGKGRAAKGHLDTAIELAKRSSFQPPLLEALSAIGRWYASNKEYDLANLHIQEAMELSSRDGLNLHHIDARISHAQLLKARGDNISSQRIHEQAKLDSDLLDYYWGKSALEPQ